MNHDTRAKLKETALLLAIAAVGTIIYLALTGQHQPTWLLDGPTK